MSQDFNLNFQEMRDGEADGHKPSEGASVENYPAQGHTRNLGFAWPDGKRLFLNYAYLVSGEFTPEANTILLEFTTHAVTIKGQKLQNLYDDLCLQITQWVICREQRYNAIDDSDNPVVNELVIARI